MHPRSGSPHADAPEAVPEYQQYDHYDPSLRAYTQSPPVRSDGTRSPPLSVSDGGFSRSNPLSPRTNYSDIHSPMPQTTYNAPEKEAVYEPQRQSQAPSYHAHAVEIGQHNPNGKQPLAVVSESDPQRVDEKKKPIYKKWPFIIIIILLIVLIAVGIALGVVFGTKKSHNSSSSLSSNSTSSSNSTTGSATGDKPGVDINTSVGGQINDAYYSKSGAWNGSGIAIAGVDQTVNEAIYAFYQDSNGVIQYSYMDPQRKWSVLGPVNAGTYKALNATPLSAVQHLVGNQLIWHVFYIDVNYTLRERIFTNSTPPTAIWEDGPLSKDNIQVWESNTIGLQACYWGNYYGISSGNGAQPSAGIHLWYAASATTFEQYSWTNGTSDWNHDQSWEDISGNGGVGCQTWLGGQTEYVWFVDTHENIAMYWIDNNRSATATPDHPIQKWTPVDIGIHNVQRDSSLGYTNFLIYQGDDTTIRGANITWAAENTTIADGNGDDGKDTWILEKGNDPVHAVRGTHLSLTAVKNVGGGSDMLIFFQEEGDDVVMYTRDGTNSGALWQAAGQNPVEPSS